MEEQDNNDENSIDMQRAIEMLDLDNPESILIYNSLLMREYMEAANQQAPNIAPPNYNIPEELMPIHNEWHEEFVPQEEDPRVAGKFVHPKKMFLARVEAWHPPPMNPRQYLTPSPSSSDDSMPLPDVPNQVHFLPDSPEHLTTDESSDSSDSSPSSSDDSLPAPNIALQNNFHPESPPYFDADENGDSSDSNYMEVEYGSASSDEPLLRVPKYFQHKDVVEPMQGWHYMKTLAMEHAANQPSSPESSSSSSSSSSSGSSSGSGESFEDSENTIGFIAFPRYTCKAPQTEEAVGTLAVLNGLSAASKRRCEQYVEEKMEENPVSEDEREPKLRVRFFSDEKPKARSISSKKSKQRKKYLTAVLSKTKEALLRENEISDIILREQSIMMEQMHAQIVQNFSPEMQAQLAAVFNNINSLEMIATPDDDSIQ